MTPAELVEAITESGINENQAIEAVEEAEGEIIVEQ
jgi:hypothetical protein